MPFARIDIRKGKDAAYRREIGRVVYEAGDDPDHLERRPHGRTEESAL